MRPDWAKGTWSRDQRPQAPSRFSGVVRSAWRDSDLGSRLCPGTQGSCGRFGVKPQLCQWVLGFPRRAGRPYELEAWHRVGGETSPSARAAGLRALGVATSGARYGPLCGAFPPVSVALGMDLRPRSRALTDGNPVPPSGPWQKGPVRKHAGNLAGGDPGIPGEENPAEKWTPCTEGLGAAGQRVLLEGGLGAPHAVHPEESRQNAGSAAHATRLGLLREEGLGLRMWLAPRGREAESESGWEATEGRVTGLILGRKAKWADGESPWEQREPGTLVPKWGAFREVRPSVFALKCLGEFPRAWSAFRVGPHPEGAGRGRWACEVRFPCPTDGPRLWELDDAGDRPRRPQRQ